MTPWPTTLAPKHRFVGRERCAAHLGRRRVAASVWLGNRPQSCNSRANADCVRCAATSWVILCRSSSACRESMSGKYPRRQNTEFPCWDVGSRCISHQRRCGTGRFANIPHTLDLYEGHTRRHVRVHVHAHVHVLAAGMWEADTPSGEQPKPRRSWEGKGG